jgi:ferredoxin-NADP reductase
LSRAAGPAPAWRGFRPLRTAWIERESTSVVSLTLATEDGSPLPPALPGQFLVLRLRPAANTPALLRNYSLSGDPGAGVYRVSVKQEANGKGSTFLHLQVKSGDVLEVSAPRGSFTLEPGEGPVVLLSAGIGATPVLAMLHALAARRSRREVWWLHGARNAAEHPFAREALDLAAALPRARSFVAYSRPAPGDRLGHDYDAPGRLRLIEHLRVMNRWLERPYLFVFPAIGIVAAILLAASLQRRSDQAPFRIVGIVFAAAFGTLALSFWPYMIPFSVTIEEAAAPHSSLAFMFWGAGLFVFPLMLVYTATNYRVFRGRIRPNADQYH